MTAGLVGANEGKPWLWLSKLLDTEHVKVDKKTMQSVIETVYKSHGDGPISLGDAQRWPRMGPFLKDLLPDFGASLGYGIVCFHIFTEVHLSNYNQHQNSDLITACHNLSNYMFYLLVTRPEMLPVSGTTGPTLKLFLDIIAREDWHGQSLGFQLRRARALLTSMRISSEPEVCRDTLEEILSVWTRLLLYSAGKSRAAVHAAGLSTGGELITFAWLLMAHNQLGDVGQRHAFIVGDFLTSPDDRRSPPPPPPIFDDPRPGYEDRPRPLPWINDDRFWTSSPPGHPRRHPPSPQTGYMRPPGDHPRMASASASASASTCGESASDSTC
jgi:hypothetical protein